MARGQIISDLLSGWKTLTLFEGPALTGSLSSFTSFLFFKKSKFFGFSISGPLPLLVLSQSFFYVYFVWLEFKGWKGMALINFILSAKRCSFLAKAYKSTDYLLRRATFDGSVQILFSSSFFGWMFWDFGNIIWLVKVSLEGNYVLEKGALSTLLCFWHGKSSFWSVFTCRAKLSSLLSPSNLGLASLLGTQMTDCESRALGWEGPPDEEYSFDYREGKKELIGKVLLLLEVLEGNPILEGPGLLYRVAGLLYADIIYYKASSKGGKTDLILSFLLYLMLLDPMMFDFDRKTSFLFSFQYFQGFYRSQMRNRRLEKQEH